MGNASKDFKIFFLLKKNTTYFSPLYNFPRVFFNAIIKFEQSSFSFIIENELG